MAAAGAVASTEECCPFENCGGSISRRFFYPLQAKGHGKKLKRVHIMPLDSAPSGTPCAVVRRCDTCKYLFSRYDEFPENPKNHNNSVAKTVKPIGCEHHKDRWCTWKKKKHQSAGFHYLALECPECSPPACRGTPGKNKSASGVVNYGCLYCKVRSILLRT